jgi:hypothetical protein
VVAGHFDINNTVSPLSRFSSPPKVGHLKMARKIFGYLRKYPNRDYRINPNPPPLDAKYESIKLQQVFGGQYHYFKEDIDLRFPPPLLKELEVNMFYDADHGFDKVTGRSITGIINFVGSTPIFWDLKLQSCIQTSTFGSEFIALKRAVDKLVMIRYTICDQWV